MTDFSLADIEAAHRAAHWRISGIGSVVQEAELKRLAFWVKRQAQKDLRLQDPSIR